jgi:PhzF family phenazine biosynthesis protein
MEDGMSIAIYQVDSFTAEPFAGNPAGVCLLQGEREADWMKAVAREMNLAETAFLHSEQDGFGLRWFTPTLEVDLCGHATLAAAHVLWETGQLDPAATARFHTRSGVLTAQRSGAWIELDFPATPVEPAPMPEALQAALAVRPRYLGRSRFDYLVELDGEGAVRSLQPDLRELRGLESRGVIVTARSDRPEDDFVSRFFAPAAGIDEDPVTGSAHCALAPFWAERLGKSSFRARQLSARGGFLRVRLDGERVVLAGQAVTVLRGELLA